MGHSEIILFPNDDEFLDFIAFIQEQYNEQKNKDDGCGEL